MSEREEKGTRTRLLQEIEACGLQIGDLDLIVPALRRAGYAIKPITPTDGDSVVVPLGTLSLLLTAYASICDELGKPHYKSEGTYYALMKAVLAVAQEKADE